MKVDYFSLCKDFLCVQKMDEQHTDSFKELVNVFADKMNKRTVISGRPSVVYDFQHHSLNLYKIISNIIFDEGIVYTENVGFQQTELYILNLAVLLHAISIFETDVKQLCDYPKESANLVNQWFENSTSVLSSNCILKRAERDVLIDVIRVHNDTTDDVSKACDLTELNKLVDIPSFQGGKIRSRLLAGVLRLANKMDFTSERLGNDDSEEQLRKLIENKEYAVDSEEEFNRSKRDFEKLHYISYMDRSENRKQVILVIDDKYVDKKLNDGSYLEDVRDFLVTTYSEFELQLSEIKSKVFDTYEAAHYVQLQEIDFKTNNKELDSLIKNKLELMRSGERKKGRSKNSNEGDVKEGVNEVHSNTICLISNDISQRLSKEVTTRNLLKFGHFRLDNQYCARDWIDTRELVETEKIMSEMVKHIIAHINANFSEKDLVVGVDLVGSLLASRIVFPLNCPMTYVIPDIVIPFSGKPDINVDLSGYNKVIIVVDSIVTGETLNKIIHDKKLENKIIAIYTMFYRKCSAPMLLEESLLSKTYCLNDTYMAEIYEMKNCPYKDKKCMARNSRVS